MYTALWFLVWFLLHFIFSIVLYEFDFDGSKRRASGIKSSSSKPHGGGSNSASGVKDAKRRIISNFRPVTGILALCLFMVVYIPAIPAIRKRFYDFFYYSHHFFILAAIALGYHSKRVNPLWMFFVCLYVVDRTVRMIQIKRAPGFRAYQWSSDTLELFIDTIHLNKNKTSKFKFGLIYLVIPSVSYLECHPFDICYEEGDRSISLFIKKQGKWTSKLFEIIAKNDFSSITRESRITIADSIDSNNDPLFINNDEIQMYSIDERVSSGPETIDYRNSPQTNEPLLARDLTNCRISLFVSSIYQSTFHYVFENEVAILVASGSGISPMLSIIKYFIKTKDDLKTKKIYLFWTNKDEDGIQIIKEIQRFGRSVGEPQTLFQENIITMEKYNTTPSSTMTPSLRLEYKFNLLIFRI
ncbi:putative ferric reduction oxidase 1 [Smittium mucronatum]|uniref:Putative ferric reduction oxidase 1 n=1 Tax=Smittium mucronatum TaxID=133383 RepID=A0A1R0H2A6_9FUNG|nr:putative ferric reduction oxidase 1 [Smittium mucronatum]